MNFLLESGKDFKIIPGQFENSTSIDIENVNESELGAVLKYLSETEAASYQEGGEVEVFGLTNEGLIYFTTEILSRSGANLVLKVPKEHKNIQRREYSRVITDSKIELLSRANAEIKTLDISAGGVRLALNFELKASEEHPVLIKLTNNAEINCNIQIIRTDTEGGEFVTSARFTNIKSIDRIALVQYTFKALTEEENKTGDNG